MQPLFPNVNEDKVDSAGNALEFIFIVMFGCLFVICSLVLLHSLILRHKWNIVKCLKILLPLPPLAREIAFLVNWNTADYMTQPLNDQSVTNSFLNSAPGYFLFSVYLMLVLFWIFMYHSRSDNSVFMRNLLIVFFIINTIVYSVWCIFTICMYIFDSYVNQIHAGERIFASFIDATLCFGFFIYGIKLLSILKSSETQLHFVYKRVSKLLDDSRI